MSYTGRAMNHTPQTSITANISLQLHTKSHTQSDALVTSALFHSRRASVGYVSRSSRSILDPRQREKLRPTDNMLNEKDARFVRFSLFVPSRLIMIGI